MEELIFIHKIQCHRCT